MPLRRQSNAFFVRRVGLLGLAVAGGLLACLALLLVAARPAWAAPTATDHLYPGSAPCDTTLQACIDGAVPGDSITLQAGTYITSFTLSQAISLTGVASSAVTIQALPGQRVMTVTGAFLNPTVVISGLTFSGGDVSGALTYPANCGGGVQLAFNNEPLLINIIISGSTATLGGGLCADSGARVNLRDSQILSNTALGSSAGGIRVAGHANISGSLFQGNHCLGSTCSGGAMYAITTLALTNTQFIDNRARNDGGAVRVGGTAVIQGGLFQLNQCVVLAGCEGGALHAETSLTVTGTQFISNSAHARGGAVRSLGNALFVGAVFQGNDCLQSTAFFCIGGGLNSGLSVTLSDTQFVANTAMSRAGAVYADSAAIVLGGVLLNNQCSELHCLGGGMLVAGTLTATNAQFINNVASGAYGGLWAVGPATLSGGVFQGNTCTQDGCQAGGMFATSAVVMTSTQFLTNSALGSGGGLVASDGLTLTAGLFQNNSCHYENCQGGALMTIGSAAISDTVFVTNTARQHGGALRAHGALVLNGGQFQGNRCLLDDCSGGAVYSGGTLALTGTQFTNNTALFGGGGVHAENAARLTNGVFHSNQCTGASCRGGGLSVAHNRPVTLTAMLFLSNTALGQGGGVNAQDTAMVAGGLFQANTCTADDCTGGGLFAGDTLSVTGTQFIANAARLHGGAVHADQSAVLANSLLQANTCAQITCTGGGLRSNGAFTLINTQVVSNTSHASGGGVHGFNAGMVTGGLVQANACTQDNCFGGGLYVVTSLSLSGTQVIGNAARLDGGGVYAGGDAVLNGGQFQANACAQENCQGGGLYALNNLSLTGTAFYTNTARFSGGGAYANVGGLAVLNGGLFQGNQCTQTGCRGGGLNVNGGLALTGTQFIGNRAVFDGGGLRTAGPATLANGLFRANTAYQGGGFYHAGGTGHVINTLFADNTAAESGTAVYVNGASGLFALVHDTIGMAASNNLTSAVQVAAGSVGITNTVFVYHDYGIRRSGGTVYQDYNFFAQVGIPADGGVTGGAHSLTGNPAFIDPVDGDFRLAPGSLAVDTGTDAGIYVDFEGQARPFGTGFDMGYHEAVVFRLYLPAVLRP